jgi:hypothetical protein
MKELLYETEITNVRDIKTKLYDAMGNEWEECWVNMKMLSFRGQLLPTLA